jgi:hypothetical protein
VSSFEKYGLLAEGDGKTDQIGNRSAKIKISRAQAILEQSSELAILGAKVRDLQNRFRNAFQQKTHKLNS